MLKLCLDADDVQLLTMATSEYGSTLITAQCSASCTLKVDCTQT